MYFDETVSVRMSDCDRTGKLSYEGILQLLETAGSHHSDFVGDNMVDSTRSGVAWIIADWRLAIHRRPENGEQVHITTWVRGKAPSSVLFREFRAEDAAGQTVLLAQSRLTLVNTQTGRIVRMTQDRLDTYGAEGDTVFPEDLPRLRAPQVWEQAQPISLRRSDIDYNGHVHNTRYVTLALEAVADVREYAGLSIHYATPILEESEVILRRTGDTVGIYTGDTLCALVRLDT